MFSYNPYQPQPSYYSPFSDYDPYHPTPSYAAPARARALAEERARERARAQLQAQAKAQAAQQQLRDRYLIPEYEEDRSSSDDEYSGYGAGEYTPYGYAPGYGSSYGLSPRERAYLEQKYHQERERKKEMLKRRAMEEEIERRKKFLQAEEAKRQAAKRAPSSSPKRRTIPIRSPSPEPRPQHLPSPPHSRQTSPAREAPPSPIPTPQAPSSISIEKQHEAASRIQRVYRTYHALRTVQSLQSQFEQLHGNFNRPEKVDFQGPGGEVITIDVYSRPDSLPQISPKLAYTPTNVPLHGYVESLNRLLVALDAVQSHGAKEVREKRKVVVQRVEREAAEVEQWWKGIWEGKGANDEMEVCKEDKEVEGHEMQEVVTECSSTTNIEGSCNVSQEAVQNNENIDVAEMHVDVVDSAQSAELSASPSHPLSSTMFPATISDNTSTSLQSGEASSPLSSVAFNPGDASTHSPSMPLESEDSSPPSASIVPDLVASASSESEDSEVEAESGQSLVTPPLKSSEDDVVVKVEADDGPLSIVLEPPSPQIERKKLDGDRDLDEDRMSIVDV